MREKRVSRNHVCMEMNLDKTIKKLIKKGKAKPFTEELLSCFDAKLTNGQTVADFVAQANMNNKCYFYALMLAYGIGEGTLVHGKLHNLDAVRTDGGSYEEFEHAWLEVDDDLVIDSSMKTVFEKETYYSVFDVEIQRQYEVGELLHDTQSFKQLAKSSANNCYEVKKMLTLFPQFEKTKE